ncbi:hypothetical protein POTOM_003634 [Populus tomentosa]|uniref:DUF538 family protein n=1 Tax=Populus tomentosa TaxID=118781 RepID=A0A8X8AIW4_POPTO|nr:hypothetical protein POTOM_003634 [Populus tomentosa]
MASFNTLALLSLYLLSLLLLSKSRLSLSLVSSDIHDLLPQYGLPRGLLPDNVESYTLPSSDGSFEVKLKTPCYVHFDDVVYYDKVIKGKLSYGSVHDVSGIQAKKLFIWLPVTGIEVSKADDGMISFFVGPISEELPAKQFEDVPACSDLAVVIRGFPDNLGMIMESIWSRGFLLVPASNGCNSHKLIRFYGVSQQLKKVSCSCCRWKQTKSSHALPAHFEH